MFNKAIEHKALFFFLNLSLVIWVFLFCFVYYFENTRQKVSPPDKHPLLITEIFYMHDRRFIAWN